MAIGFIAIKPIGKRCRDCLNGVFPDALEPGLVFWIKHPRDIAGILANHFGYVGNATSTK